MTKNYIQKIRVNPGEMIMFTNTCLHSGDVNNFNKFCLQLFAYMVSNPIDFPDNFVMLYDWTDNTENARITTQTLTTEKKKMKIFTESNIHGERSVKCSHHAGARVSYQTERFRFP
jgi:hypothetical protein